MALMQYSVSPRCVLSSFGPKPSEKVSTRTPMRRAIRKCPSSCTNTRTPSTNAKASRVTTDGSSSSTPGRHKGRPLQTPETRRFHRELRQQVAGTGARPVVDGAHLRERPDSERLVRSHRFADQFRNGHEADLAIEERRDSNLVRRVQDNRQTRLTGQRLAR